MTEFVKLLKIESVDFYPLVYIPALIKKNLNDDQFYVIDKNILISKYTLRYFYPSKPKKPLKPEEPSKYTVEYYDDINHEQMEEHVNKLFKQLFYLFLLIVLLIVTLKYGIYIWTIIIGYGCILPIFHINGVIKEMYKTKKNKYTRSRSILKTEQELASDISKYQIKLKEYEKAKNEYERALNEYFVKEVEYLKPYEVKFIHEKYLKLIQSNIKFSRTNSIPQKGKSENIFLKYLLKYFESEKIMINIELKDNYDVYYPDFLYVSKDNSLYIDIEIDEQYDYETKNPIHYLRSDDKRNDFFLNHNCFIIRFTEKQVEEEPDKCCMFIKDVIRVIVEPQLYELKTNIMKIKRWTYEEAYLLGKANSRNT